MPILDPRTRASDPGGLTVSLTKLRRLRPDLFGWGQVLHQILVFTNWHDYSHRRFIAAQLKSGDSRAAVVISVSPLIVAAYTDELDTVAILRFDDETLVTDYNLKPGSKLLTVNTYTAGRGTVPRDLTVGPLQHNRYINFSPMIAEFLSDDMPRINARKAKIRDEEWQRTVKLAQAALRDRPNVSRDGRPVLAGRPGKAR